MRVPLNANVSIVGCLSKNRRIFTPNDVQKSGKSCKRLDVLPGTPELANVRLICQSKWCKIEKGTGKKRMVFKGCRYS